MRKLFQLEFWKYYQNVVFLLFILHFYFAKQLQVLFQNVDLIYVQNVVYSLKGSNANISRCFHYKNCIKQENKHNLLFLCRYRCMQITRNINPIIPFANFWKCFALVIISFPNTFKIIATLLPYSMIRIGGLKLAKLSCSL